LEVQFLDSALESKKRKNDGDRLRRQRLKELGFSAKHVVKPGISARGPLPHQYLPPPPVNGYAYPMPPYGVVPGLPPPYTHAQGPPHPPLGSTT
jgi:hypothetical protein